MWNVEEKWQQLLAKYAIIKELYIRSEETDPELKTNLQPLNEFRAALDHIMKMMTAYVVAKDEKNFETQYDKLNSHFNRAFFDICDFLSINYRNKICDTLTAYDTETIRTVFPKYYSEWRPLIEKISENIAKRRRDKGKNVDEDFNQLQQYQEDIFALADIYDKIVDGAPSLEEVEKDLKTGQWKGYIISAVLGAVAGIILSNFNTLFQALLSLF